VLTDREIGTSYEAQLREVDYRIAMSEKVVTERLIHEFTYTYNCLMDIFQVHALQDGNSNLFRQDTFLLSIPYLCFNRN